MYQLQPVFRISADTAEAFTASRILGENSVIHLDKCIHRLETSEIKSSTRFLPCTFSRNSIQLSPGTAYPRGKRIGISNGKLVCNRLIFKVYALSIKFRPNTRRNDSDWLRIANERRELLISWWIIDCCMLRVSNVFVTINHLYIRDTLTLLLRCYHDAK